MDCVWGQVSIELPPPPPPPAGRGQGMCRLICARLSAATALAYHRIQIRSDQIIWADVKIGYLLCRSLNRQQRLANLSARGIAAIFTWREVHRRGANESVSMWMNARTPMAGELMAILEEKDPKNRWTRYLPAMYGPSARVLWALYA